MSEREIVLTEEERRNGWTEESLRSYLAERERAASRLISRDPELVQPKRPTQANSKYSPFAWRR